MENTELKWYEKTNSGVYTYNGELGVLMFIGDAQELGFTEYMEELNDKGFFAFCDNDGLEQLVRADQAPICACYDDSYDIQTYFSEIDTALVQNIEYDQGTVYEWCSIGYIADDFINRQYLTVTNRYYHWKSELYCLSDSIRREIKQYEEGEYYIEDEEEGHEYKFLVQSINSTLELYIKDAVYTCKGNGYIENAFTYSEYDIFEAFYRLLNGYSYIIDRDDIIDLEECWQKYWNEQ